ncbi:MAG: lysophospholipid acyltransferase family protein [Dehalococcoidia bacterium]
MWCRVHVEGQEHVAGDGPFILVSNHVDNWDPHVVGLYVRGRVVCYMARADGLHSRWLGWFWRRLRAIPADRDGLGQALKILKAGGVVGVFPEGVIAPALAPAIPGSAVLALRSGAMVVPAAVWGTERIRWLSFLRPPRVHVRYGPPRTLKRGSRAEAATDDLMRAIAAMLPPEYRGVYAGPSPAATVLPATASATASATAVEGPPPTSEGHSSALA